jgi:hypothetical protein
MNSMRGWLVGARFLDPSPTQFPTSIFLIWFYYLKPVLIWPVLGTEGAGARYRSLELNCSVLHLVPILGT